MSAQSNSVVKSLLKPVVHFAGTRRHRCPALVSLRICHLLPRSTNLSRSRRLECEAPRRTSDMKTKRSGSQSLLPSDLLVAGFVHAAAPARHIDVGTVSTGSLLTSLVRTIEIIDVRPLEPLEHASIRSCRRILWTARRHLPRLQIPSRACMQSSISGSDATVIHRPQGPRKGVSKHRSLVEAERQIYISFPIGARTETHFNAHRIFNQWTFSVGRRGRAQARALDFVDDAGNLHLDVDVTATPSSLRYACGKSTPSQGGGRKAMTVSSAKVRVREADRHLRRVRLHWPAPRKYARSAGT